MPVKKIEVYEIFEAKGIIHFFQVIAGDTSQYWLISLNVSNTKDLLVDNLERQTVVEGFSRHGRGRRKERRRGNLPLQKRGKVGRAVKGRAV